MGSHGKELLSAVEEVTLLFLRLWDLNVLAFSGWLVRVSVVSRYELSAN